MFRLERDFEEGTCPDFKILFFEVNILDSTGTELYRGDVYVEYWYYVCQSFVS